MKALTRTFLCIAGLVALSWTRPAAADIPAPERLLPDDTLIVLTIPDFARMREINRTSPQTQLWQDPALKPFRDKFLAKLKSDLAEPLERELGIKLEDYFTLPQGQVTLAVTKADWQGPESGEPGLVLMLDTRDKAGLLKTNLAELRRKWIDSGKAIKTEKVRDVEFSILSFSEKDLSPTLRKLLGSDEDEEEDGDERTAADTTTIVFGQHESLLIVGTSVKALEKVAVRLSGGSVPSLGELAAFESSRASIFRDAPLYGWMNTKALMDLLIPKTSEPADDDDPFAIFEPEKILSAIGIRGIQTVAFNMLTGDEGTSLHFSIGIPESGRQGLFRLFPGEAKDAGPPPFVSADVAKFQRWRIDGQKAWAAIEKMLNDISPQVGGIITSMMDMINMSAREQDPSFDIRKNLIGNLGDDVITIQQAPKGSTLEEISSPPSLYLIGSPRPEQLASGFRTVLALASQGSTDGLKEREFLGRKVYSLTLPLSPLDGTSQTLHCAATASYLAVSTDVSILEAFLRNTEGQQKPLRELAGITEATARVGGSSSGWFGYENQRETTRAVIEMLRKSASDDSEPMLAPGIPAFRPESAFQEWFDFSLLPPFDRIAKYFHYSVYSAGSNVDGIWIKVFAPVPPQLRN
ncbi:MAG TPA: hypothetical protein GYA07_01195 [Verrucomicrobia bacterium]|nr:hypothetical protein [Verrucomicrobiota bacterium]HOP98400.1 hypothetical protein [Verrucomicrobiota bacterium]